MSTIRYTILTEVSVTHGYYRKGLFKDLTIQPDAPTRRYMERSGLMFKTTDRGFSLYISQTIDNEGLMQRLKPIGTKLVFNLYSENPWYTNFTRVPMDKLTFFEFSNQRKSSTDEEQLIPEIRLSEVSSGKIASVTLDLKELAAGQEKYKVHFETRSCQWNYYMVGAGEADQKLFKVEGPDGTTFSGPQVINNLYGQTYCYSSGESIYPMAEYPEKYSTLLKYNESNGAYKLVERLPAPFPSSITNYSQSDNGMTPVAETSIYIYL